MAKEPTIGAFIDDEERELYESLQNDADDWVSIKNPELVERYQRAAQRTLDERAKITIRIPRRNLAKLKARALREGIPYQTLINSILHKAVNE